VEHSQKEEPLLITFAKLIAMLVVLFSLLWYAGCFSQAPPPKPNEEMIARQDELSDKLSDPRVSMCFHAAFAMGKQFREQGRLKPSDTELHHIGLLACDEFKVPANMRGVAVDKFKSGFGWGWFSTR
jgi:hypothetical protein